MKKLLYTAKHQIAMGTGLLGQVDRKLGIIKAVGLIGAIRFYANAR